MKLFVKNLLLYLSAFVPMYILVFVKLVVEIINQNLSFNILNTTNFLTLLLLIGFGVWGIVWNVYLSNDKIIEVEIVSKRNITDQHFLGYFSLFVFFAIPLDLSLVSAYCVYVLVLIMIGVVYINNSLYYINPFLNLLGYNFYDIEYKEVGFNKIKNAKFFYRGDFLEVNQTYMIKIKNQHFCFVDKKLSDKNRHFFKNVNKFVDFVKISVYNKIKEVTMAAQRKGWVLAIVCYFLGALGVHRFMVGKVGTGVLWLFTGGCFGIGVLIDFIMILCGAFKDKAGNKIPLGL